MKTISLVAYNRPDYLRITLASLRRLDWSGYEMFICLERGAHRDVKELCEAIDWIPRNIYEAQQKLGCDRNTYRSLCMPFDAGSDFNIYMEDDIEVSLGLRAMADWYCNYNDQEAVCLCPESYEKDPTKPTNLLLKCSAFNSHGLMCSKQQFEKHMRKQWLDNSLSKDTNIGWDWNMMNYVTRYSGGSYILVPSRPYTHHIGERGTYSTKTGYRESGQAELVLCHDVHSEFVIKPELS